jgi:hypothetical protein
VAAPKALVWSATAPNRRRRFFMKAPLRRIFSRRQEPAEAPAAAASPDPAPSATTVEAEQPTVLQTPADAQVELLPAGVAPEDVVPPRASFRNRGRLRRRMRYLRRVRELGFRDLGGLAFDLHRFGRRNDELVLGKLQALDAVDRELRAIERALDERRDIIELREPGIAACPRCGALHSSDARFCPSCGTQFSGPLAIADVAPHTTGAAAPAGPGAAGAAPASTPATGAPWAPSPATGATSAPTAVPSEPAASAPAPPAQAPAPGGDPLSGALGGVPVQPPAPSGTSATEPAAPTAEPTPAPGAPGTPAAEPTSPPSRTDAPGADAPSTPPTTDDHPANQPTVVLPPIDHETTAGPSVTSGDPLAQPERRAP